MRSRRRRWPTKRRRRSGRWWASSCFQTRRRSVKTVGAASQPARAQRTRRRSAGFERRRRIFEGASQASSEPARGPATGRLPQPRRSPSRARATGSRGVLPKRRARATAMRLWALIAVAVYQSVVTVDAYLNGDDRAYYDESGLVMMWITVGFAMFISCCTCCCCFYLQK